jgi:AcrR family transcriptional regulator
MIETRDKIIETAERLFADRGYAGTSLRQIIAEAGVNLAAIHYHFGNKEELLDQLVQRKAGPVNKERLEMLDRYEAEADGVPVAVEKILRAFLAPPMRRIKEHPEFAKLMGRLYGEGLMPIIAERHFQTIINRFTAAFGRALPHLDEKQLAVRLQFMVGAMSHTMMFACQQFPIEGKVLVNELMAFIVGGLRAPAAEMEQTGKNL